MKRHVLYASAERALSELERISQNSEALWELVFDTRSRLSGLERLLRIGDPPVASKIHDAEGNWKKLMQNFSRLCDAATSVKYSAYRGELERAVVSMNHLISYVRSELQLRFQQDAPSEYRWE